MSPNNNPPSKENSSRERLLTAATNFCNPFANRQPLSSILEHFSTAHANDIIVMEHGLPQLAPFLGRRFVGVDAARTYFTLINDCLDYRDMRFSDYTVDCTVNRVSVRGAAQFTWVGEDREGSRTWDEEFTYMLQFDEELKVLKYEIWADSGAAYLASKGEL